MKNLNNKIDNIVNEIENFIKKVLSYELFYYLVAVLFLFVLYYFNMKQKVSDADASNIYNTRFIIFGSIISIISFILIFIINKFKKLSIYKMFIILSLVLGSIYIFCMPMFSQSDEPTHYLKSYSVAMGRLSVNGKNGKSDFIYPEIVKKSIYYNSDAKKWREYKTYEDNKDLRNMKPNYDEDKYVIMENMSANYPSINYFPQAIGMKIGMILNLNSYWIGMLGRIFNLIFCTLLLALGLKWLPYKKNAAIVILLSPVVLSYNAAFSIDGALLCYSFLFISYILRMREEKRKMNLKSMIYLLILTVLISITKLAYFPIVAVAFLIPKESYKNSNIKKVLFALLLIIIGVTSSFVYLHLMNRSISTNGSYINAWIYHSPVRLLYVFFNDLMVNGYDYITNIFAGHYLCHNQIDVYPLLSFAYIILFILSVKSEEIKNKFKYIDKALFLAIFMLVSALVFLAMYLANTVFNNPFAIGVQGRYYIPVLMLFVLLFNKKNNDISTKTFYSLAVIMNLAIMLSMVVRFMFFSTVGI